MLDAKNNEYINQWKEWVNKELEALNSGDYDLADTYANLSKQAHEDFVSDNSAKCEFESKSFGMLNHIFENNLTDLYKVNPSLIKEYVSLIKNDKNLLSEQIFFNSIRGIKDKETAKDVVMNALDLLENRINPKTIQESNKKAIKFLSEHRNELNIEYNNSLDEFYKNCEKLMETKKKLSTLPVIMENVDKVTKFINENFINNSIIENNEIDFATLIEDYENKYGETLNEDEKAFINKLTKAQNDLQSYKELFEDVKTKCLTKIDEMSKTSNPKEKQGLIDIAENIKLMDSNTISEIKEDFHKIMKIMDILE